MRRPDDAFERRGAASVVLFTTIATGFALYFARTVVVPVTFALFIIAIVWPVQRALQRRIPKLLAVVATVLLALIAILAFASLLTWGFSRVAQWLVANAARFQLIYTRLSDSLEEHGLLVTGVFTDTFNANWLLRRLQNLGSRIHGLTSFLIITFVYVLLGLMEVNVSHTKLKTMESHEIARVLIDASRNIAAKLQKYMAVRTLMSIMTGLVVWVFALISGLELATAWGVIAFTLNYIPFLGPLVATIFPTMFAIVQFESWQMGLIVFLSLNLIQFVIGSYLEPRIAGAALSISPFVVLFSVFFWAFLWGIPGAFIGVPVTIAILTVCAECSSTRWIADLLSAPVELPS
jgi:predicted PurR-regulated permease PerM